MSEIWHKIAKRSWWNGAVTAVCGATAPAGQYETRWFTKVTCPSRKAKAK